MAMIRKEARGDYQIGIYSVQHASIVEGRGRKWIATTGRFGYLRKFKTLADAYLHLTGEPLRAPRRDKGKQA